MVGTPNPRKLRAAGLVVPSYEGSGEGGGFSPEDLRDAYKLPAKGGQGLTVAITIAFGDPNAEKDLAVYREHYGLPPCTTANGCFSKVNQEGEEANYPEPDTEWALETSLDLDMVSATCPECDILLVEADTNFADDLGSAVEEAASLGADVISNSWLEKEASDEAVEDHYYDHPGIPTLFASGDDGYGVGYPAASPDVIAVGGTKLKKDEGPRGWSEKVWSGAGSGCSAYEEKPAWQIDEGCEGRTVADVSAVASSATPVSVYATYGGTGWRTTGGTSVSAPLLAGVEALSEDAVRAAGPSVFPRIGQGGGLFDPTEGNNGNCGSYLCEAKVGYDGPTGWGTPDGPLSLPVAVSEGASIGSESEATLHGSVDPKGSATKYRFEYGKTASYGTSIPVPDASAGSGAEYVEVAQTVKGLEGHTTYHYRITAVNSESSTFHGVDRAFATTPPSMTTGSAPEFHGNDATLSASINPNGAETFYWFEYGLSGEYGSKAPLRTRGILEPGTKAVAVSESIGPLLANKTYHFRVVANNVAGTTYGSDQTLATPPAEWFARLPSAAEKATSLPAISCVSEEDCLVLGKPSSNTYGLAWRLHDGEWSALPDIFGPQEATYMQPNDLSCTSISQCVATGFYIAPGSGQPIEKTRPLVAGWDGTEWQLTSVPMPAAAVSGAGSIESISCASASSCTAVGWFAASKGSGLYRRPLIERWDGKAWAYETLPESPAGWGQLKSVSCTSSSYCLAAGYYEIGSSESGTGWRAFVESWDGSKWATALAIQPGGYEHPHYSGVSCDSANACMAVGTSAGYEGYFASQWDGKAWAIKFLPAPTGSATEFDGSVSCPSASFCAFVASASGGAPSTRWPVAFAWSGSGWTEQSTGRPRLGEEYSTSSFLSEVECVSSSMCIGGGEASGHAMLATYPPPQPPTATTEAASDFTKTAATLHGTVNPNGVETEYHFDYGPTSSYGSKTEAVEVGDGTKEVKVSLGVFGLQLGVTYHYRLVAESEAGTSYGEEETFTTKVSTGIALEPPGASFPASFSLASEAEVRLSGPATVKCTTKSGIKALGGEGEFKDATSGTATLTLRNCTSPIGSKCTSSGQAEGTIKTEALPIRLTYLSDGKPGLLFLPNATSGKLATASCPFVGTIVVSGSGVLGQITKPPLGATSQTLTVDINAPEGKQQYTKTEAGLEYGLLESVNEGEAKAATLEAEAVETFSGDVELRALRPPTATTKAASAVKVTEATLNGTVNPEGDETTYQFEYVDQADFSKNGYENAASVPASPKAIGSGASVVSVSETVTGLEPDLTYHFRTAATNRGGTAYGEDETLTTAKSGRSLTLEPPASFPASFSLASEAEVRLSGPATVKCTTKSGIKALGGEGEFKDAGSGTATLTLRNCKSPIGTNCTSSGQAEGTIKTEALPIRLTYLSDGKPGLLFLPNATSGKLATASCPLVGTIVASGSGVLGQITQPAPGEASSTLTVDLKVPEGKQKYTTTEAGLEYGLTESIGGGAPKAATLQAEAVASFGGKVGLAERQLVLEPPASFPASFSLASEAEVRLSGPATIKCTTKSGTKALGGEGEFKDATSGTATLTLRNCTSPIGTKCTSSGQAEGTIKTEALPIRLTYLSDGKPGLLFLPNATSGKLATASCPLVGTIVASGSGVLGQITQPAPGEASSTLTVAINAPEGKQKYTKTEAGLEYGLTESIGGGAPKAGTLLAEAVASFGGGEVALK